MENEKIKIYGARSHNLKNIEVEFPKNKLVVFCGVSGSGKSSLAFDTIFAEGQRRYVESLSAYARQFLGQVDKPDIDRIEGLSPAVAIDQKSVNHNPRSTVGTVTEIWDHLRLLWSRIGIPLCLECKVPLKSQSIDNLHKNIEKNYMGEDLIILSPIVRDKKGSFGEIIEDVKSKGYSRVRIDNKLYKIDEIEGLLTGKSKHNIEVVIDRVKIKDESKRRVRDGLEQGIKLSKGYIYILHNEKIEKYSTILACANCGESREELEPRSFSFNSPFGACEACDGLGSRPAVMESLVVQDETLTLREGAISPWSDSSASSHYLRMLKGVVDKYGGDLDTPYKKLPSKTKKIIFEGDYDLKIKSEFVTKYQSREYFATFEGINSWLERRINEASDSSREKYSQYLVDEDCNVCNGSRLNRNALGVIISEKNIHDVANMTIDSALLFFKNIKLGSKDNIIASRLLKEIVERLQFLFDVGLSYLTMTRNATTLSGGESQRIRLATQIGSGLTGVLYVLDEPSIGLHQRDNEKLLETLKKLRDLGNTVIVVEHDEETLYLSDYVVEIGPLAGSNGGQVVFSGLKEDLIKENKTITSKYLTGEYKIERKNIHIEPSNKYLKLIGAEGNNLNSIDVAIPLERLVTITGVSGSGKSTLINDTLAKILMKHLHKSRVIPSKYKKIEGLEYIDKMVVIDQSPIGRTPRSNPATYVGLFDQIRTLFSMTEESRVRGYAPGRFSFNVPERNGGGRCEECQGDGTLRIEMNFLPDVYVKCEACDGKRYNEETLTVKYKGKNISEILEMPISDASKFFAHLPALKKFLVVLDEVGLGYLTLGQSSTTLSGGEAQRIKLASELCKRQTGRTLYILDEPTTGLHFDDVKKLLDILAKLVIQNNSVIVIEHNLDIISQSDYIVDLGPEGGPKGGNIVGNGAPKEIAKLKTATGVELKKYFKSRKI